MPAEAARSAKPFVKWAGGKARLWPSLAPLLPPDVDQLRHVEPFVGGGAMFFARQPGRAALSDINADLVGAYRTLRDSVDELVRELDELARAGHAPETYYQVRERYNRGEGAGTALRAALLIYLNKTCFNGLYRVNRNGLYNVPCGRYAHPTILDEPALRAASAALAGVDLTCSSFEMRLSDLGAGDFVYLDPPYVPVSPTAAFTAYSRGGFSDADQRRLREFVAELSAKGAKVMVSNSDVPVVRHLYRDCDVTPVRCARAISAAASGRVLASELVIRAY